MSQGQMPEGADRFHNARAHTYALQSSAERCRSLPGRKAEPIRVFLPILHLKEQPMHRHLLIVVCVLACASAAAAAELPIRKAGLWDMKMVIEGRNTPAPTMQHCTNPATDKL